MEAIGINYADYVVIEQRDSANNGEIVVALVRNEQASLKRIEQMPGEVVLHPANAGMEATRYVPDEGAAQICADQRACYPVGLIDRANGHPPANSHENI